MQYQSLSDAVPNKFSFDFRDRTQANLGVKSRAYIRFIINYITTNGG